MGVAVGVLVGVAVGVAVGFGVGSYFKQPRTALILTLIPLFLSILITDGNF